jgi:hypothetical protein
MINEANTGTSGEEVLFAKKNLYIKKRKSSEPEE